MLALLQRTTPTPMAPNNDRNDNVVDQQQQQTTPTIDNAAVVDSYCIVIIDMLLFIFGNLMLMLAFLFPEKYYNSEGSKQRSRQCGGATTDDAHK